MRLGKLGPVKERNWRLCRSKPATRHLQKHIQDQLVYSLCRVGGEGDKPSGLDGKSCVSGREGGAPTPSATSASSRTESSQAKGVGQPGAGCLAHHVAQLKGSQVLRSSGQAPRCILGMFWLHIPTQGQGAASWPCCTTPQPPSSKPTAI